MRSAIKKQMANGLIAGCRGGAQAGRGDRVPGGLHATDQLPLHPQPLGAIEGCETPLGTRRTSEDRRQIRA
jgi:hypothetical protein